MNTYTREMAEAVLANTADAKIAKLRAKAKRLEIQFRNAQLDLLQAQFRRAQQQADAYRSLGATFMTDVMEGEAQDILEQMKSL